MHQRSYLPFHLNNSVGSWMFPSSVQTQTRSDRAILNSKIAVTLRDLEYLITIAFCGQIVVGAPSTRYSCVAESPLLLSHPHMLQSQARITTSDFSADKPNSFVDLSSSRTETTSSLTLAPVSEQTFHEFDSGVQLSPTD